MRSPQLSTCNSATNHQHAPVLTHITAAWRLSHRNSWYKTSKLHHISELRVRVSDSLMAVRLDEPRHLRAIYRGRRAEPRADVSAPAALGVFFGAVLHVSCGG